MLMRNVAKKVLLLSLMVCLCIVSGCGESKYSATSSILVTNGAVTTSYAETTDKISGSDISASLYLSYTVVDILNAPDIYIELADELGEKENYQSLMGDFSVARRGEDTLFIDITYSSTDPIKAIDVVNKFAEIACDYIPEFIPSARVNIASTATTTKKQGLF